MDSKLDTLFRTAFRPAEKTDAWLGISRHDPDQPQRKKDENHRKESAETSTDAATISVPALHAFLKDLLQQATAANNPSGVLHPAEREPAPQQPVNNQAAHAVAAYQNTARHTPGGHIKLSEQAPAQSPQGQTINLNQEEVRKIHCLLEDVQTLANRGISVITIEKAETFLESLAAGVRAALDDG